MRKVPLILLVIFVFIMNGCAVILQKGRRSDIEEIKSLRSEVEVLRDAHNILAQRLSKEIKDKQVRLEMAQKGLVITFVAEVLFGSGKAQLREESFPILDKVVRILQEDVLENDIGIEGHTDNEPIKYSRWKSNWELSSQRALSVLYYLESKGVSSARLSAIGYGQHRPIASNSTSQGQQLNRRVEIVILPKIAKEEESGKKAVTAVEEEEEMMYEEEELK